MKKKLSKKTITGIALLGTVALTGSVFAGWLIVDANAKGKGEGNVTVYEVTDKSLSVNDIKFKYGENDFKPEGNVIFGKPEDSSGVDSSGIWLSFGDQNMDTQSFPKALTFNVITGKDVEEAPNISVNFTVNDTKIDAYTNCLVNKYITGPSIGKLNLPDSTAPALQQNNKKQYSYSVDLGFGWGEHFENKNPYLYYNSKDRNSAYSSDTSFEDDLVASFGALYELNGATYSITIEATPSSTSAGE